MNEHASQLLVQGPGHIKTGLLQFSTGQPSTQWSQAPANDPECRSMSGV